MSEHSSCVRPNPRPPGVKPRFVTGIPRINPNRCPPPPPPACKGQLRRNSATGKCGCPPGQIVWQDIMCVNTCTDGKINRGPMGACSCPDNFEQIGGIGPCVPKCSPTQERVGGVCRELCRDGKTRNPANGECWCDPARTFELGGKCVSNCGPNEERLGGQGPCIPKCSPTQERIAGVCRDICRDGKTRNPANGECWCDPSRTFELGGKCVPNCGPNEERVGGQGPCVPKCTNGKERVNGFCKCPGNLIQIDGVGNCVAPPQTIDLTHPIKIIAPVHFGGFLRSEVTGGIIQAYIVQDVNISINIPSGTIDFSFSQQNPILKHPMGSSFKDSSGKNELDYILRSGPKGIKRVKGNSEWNLIVDKVILKTASAAFSTLASEAKLPGGSNGFDAGDPLLYIYFKNGGRTTTPHIPPPVIISAKYIKSYKNSSGKDRSFPNGLETKTALSIVQQALGVSPDSKTTGGRRKTIKRRKSRNKKTKKHGRK